MISRLLHRRLRYVLAPLVGVLLIVYFVYYAIEGDRGLFVYFRLKQQIAEAQLTLQLMQAERQEVEHRVNLLRSASLDPDLLEEQARLSLGFAHPDDYVILLQRNEPPHPIAK